jgi:hypothetical protein
MPSRRRAHPWQQRANTPSCIKAPVSCKRVIHERVIKTF